MWDGIKSRFPALAYEWKSNQAPELTTVVIFCVSVLLSKVSLFLSLRTDTLIKSYNNVSLLTIYGALCVGTRFVNHTDDGGKKRRRDRLHSDCLQPKHSQLSRNQLPRQYQAIT